MNIGVLFDLDGVLVDTESQYSEFWKSMGEEFNLSETFADDIKGTTLNSIVKYFPEESRDYVVKRIHDFELTIPYPLYTGAEKLLADLRRRGVKMAIVTSSDDVKMKHLYDQHPNFTKYFDFVIDSSQMTRSKPHPEGYLKAAKAIGLDSSQCVVIEDSIQGLQAGRSSGSKVVGFSTTNPAEMVEPLCDVCMPDISHLDFDKISKLFENE